MSPITSCQGRNIFGDKILFKMVRHADSVELIVERDEGGSMVTSSSAVFVAGFALSSLLTFQENSDHLCVAIILTIVYWSANAFLTVTSERLQVFHFAHGLQYSRHYLFGFRKVLFIHSQRVILNEVVSMQRVMVFLSCLLGPGDRLSGGNRSKYEIIPLLTHLHPRQQILKVIYNHLLDAFKKTTSNGTSLSANNHTNHSSAESPESNKSLVKSRESSSSPPSASSSVRQINHLSSC